MQSDQMSQKKSKQNSSNLQFMCHTIPKAGHIALYNISANVLSHLGIPCIQKICIQCIVHIGLLYSLATVSIW